MRAGKIPIYLSHASVPVPDKSDFIFEYVLLTDGAVYGMKSDGVHFKISTDSTWNIVGTLDLSADPNYPAAVANDVYRVIAPGRIGGVAGKIAQADDIIVCWADNAGGDEAAVGTSWSVEQERDQVLPKTVAQVQALAAGGDIIPDQLYALTDVVIGAGGLVNPVYYVRGSANRSSVELNGYFQAALGGVVYTASYDLTNNIFLGFYDPQYNNRISRSLAGGKNCVDNFPVGNVLFQNVGGHEFNLVITGAASILNSSIAPSASVSLLLGSFLNNSRVGERAIISFDNASQAVGDIYEYSSSVTLTGGSVLAHNKIAQRAFVTADSGASVVNCTVGQASSFTVNGAVQDGVTIGTSSVVATVDRGSILNSSIGNNSHLTVNGSAGGGVDVLFSNSSIGEGSTVVLGDLTNDGVQVLGSKIGNEAIVTIGASVGGSGTTLTNCEIGEGKTITVTDGVSYADMRYVHGFSNFASTLDVTSGVLIDVPYNTLVGVITIGDTCTDTITGGTGIVVSDTGVSVVLSTLTGFFKNTNTLTFVGGAGATAVQNGDAKTADNACIVTYGELANGSFVFDQVLTIKQGATTQLTANIVSDNGIDLVLKNVVLTTAGKNQDTAPINVDPINTNGYLMTAGVSTTATVVGSIVYSTKAIPVNYEFIGIWTFFSNPTTSEVIDTITNMPTDHEITILESSLLIMSNLGIVSHPIGSIGAGNIASSVLYGAVLNTANGDYMKLAVLNGEAFSRQSGVIMNFN